MKKISDSPLNTKTRHHLVLRGEVRLASLYNLARSYGINIFQHTNGYIQNEDLKKSKIRPDILSVKDKVISGR
jgi:hypothetical protein